MALWVFTLWPCAICDNTLAESMTGQRPTVRQRQSHAESTKNCNRELPQSSVANIPVANQTAMGSLFSSINRTKIIAIASNFPLTQKSQGFEGEKPLGPKVAVTFPLHQRLQSQSQRIATLGAFRSHAFFNLSGVRARRDFLHSFLLYSPAVVQSYWIWTIIDIVKTFARYRGHLGPLPKRKSPKWVAGASWLQGPLKSKTDLKKSQTCCKIVDFDLFSTLFWVFCTRGCEVVGTHFELFLRLLSEYFSAFACHVVPSTKSATEAYSDKFLNSTRNPSDPNSEKKSPL